MTLTRDQLHEAGNALYGRQWQSALARDLGVDPRTVRRWASGKIAPSPWAVREINRLLSARGQAPMGEPSLHHVTINTGHLLISGRSEVMSETMSWLAPMVAAGGGRPAGMPFAIERRSQGSALLRIGEPAAVWCGVCWDELRSSDAWMAVLALAQQSGVAHAPDSRPAIPWLAVLTTPVMFTLPPEQIMMLGDMERCLAWAIIEQDQIASTSAAMGTNAGTRDI